MGDSKKMIQSENRDYRASIIRKSSGPFEYPFNINPDYNYLYLQLEMDGETYFLKEEIDFYHDEIPDEFKPNQRYLICISDYRIEQVNGKKWLEKKKNSWNYEKAYSTYQEPESDKKLTRLRVSKVSEMPSKNGNYIHSVKTKGKKVNVSGVEKISGALTYFVALPSPLAVGSEYEINLDLFTVIERPYDIADPTTGKVQTLILKWLTSKE